MKGIVLAGGNATRLFPLTHTTCKQLLPVYDRQMIFYPLNSLILAGIKDILMIVSPHYAGQFLSLLGPIFDGSDINIQFKVQPYPRGLADAFILGEEFIDCDDVVLILGDNIFEDDFSIPINEFEGGCHIFLKEVEHPSRYGVAKLENGKIVDIIEKPSIYVSNLAVVGFYIFDSDVSSFARRLSPSFRGELEIVHLIQEYDINIKYSILHGEWFDAGTFEDLLKVNNVAAKNRLLKADCPAIEEGISKFNEQQKELLQKQLR